MHISNRFVIVYNIKLLFECYEYRSQYYKFELRGLFNGKIGSRLQIPLFFSLPLIKISRPPPPPAYFDPSAYLILPNVAIHSLY